jgi:hypothetical protein
MGEEAFISTSEIIDGLTRLDESPWLAMGRKGQAITDVVLANKLRKFRIRPKTNRVGDRTPRGYFRADFADAWSRYLRQIPKTVKTPKTSA